MSEVIIRDGQEPGRTVTTVPPIGTAFRGSISGHAYGTHIVTFDGVVTLNSRKYNSYGGGLAPFAETYKVTPGGTLYIENYEEVDLEIIVKSK